MSGDGPTPQDLFNRLRDTAQQFDTSPENLARWAPAVPPAMLGMYWLRRPLAVGAGIAGLTWLAGPKVLEAGRQLLYEEIQRTRQERNKPPR